MARKFRLIFIASALCAGLVSSSSLVAAHGTGGRATSDMDKKIVDLEQQEFVDQADVDYWNGLLTQLTSNDFVVVSPNGGLVLTTRSSFSNWLSKLVTTGEIDVVDARRIAAGVGADTRRVIAELKSRIAAAEAKREKTHDQLSYYLDQRSRLRGTATGGFPTRLPGGPTGGFPQTLPQQQAAVSSQPGTLSFTAGSGTMVVSLVDGRLISSNGRLVSPHSSSICVPKGQTSIALSASVDGPLPAGAFLHIRDNYREFCRAAAGQSSCPATGTVPDNPTGEVVFPDGHWIAASFQVGFYDDQGHCNP